MRRFTLPLLCASISLAAFTCTGCNVLIPAMILAGPPTKEVKAEFSRLADKKVLVHVWVPPSVQQLYPHSRFDVARYVAGKLRADIKGVTTVSTNKVEDYVSRSSDPVIDSAELGRRFDADMVVYIEVLTYQMRDPDSPQLFRGQISGSVNVFDLVSAGEQAERYELSSATAVHPPSGPVSVLKTDEQTIRKQTSEAFAEEVCKKFKDHKVELE